MNRSFLFAAWSITALVSGLINLSCSHSGSAIHRTDFTALWDTLRVLENPHKGWYHHLLDNGVEHYGIRDDSLFCSFPGMDHVYIRIAWSYLEPSEGQYDWHRIDEIVKKYVPLGYGISFRITSKETGTFPGTVNQQRNGIQYATPYWVQKAGANGVVSEMWGIKSWTPDWDDPVYLDKLNRFHRAFAARYDGQSWLRYVDIGSIGEWGEGHTSFSTRIAPTVAEVKANLDIYLKNYKKSQLVCTDDLIYYGKEEKDIKILLDYVLSNGISLRDDSPLVDWYLQQNLDTWSVSHPQFYDSLYLHKPIIFELQHYGMVKDDGNWLGPNGEDTIPKYGYSGADIMCRAIETMHATYIGYHGYAEEWLSDNPELTRKLANLCGYWFIPVSASWPVRSSRDELIVSMEWLNKGVAPAYQVFNIQFRLTGSSVRQPVDIMIEDAGNRTWLPKRVSEEEYALSLPEDLPKARYLMKIRLVEKTGEVLVPVDVGLVKSSFDKDGFMELGEVQIK